ncbi:MAG: META domain-containing protein [Oceanicaulis sp.]
MNRALFAAACALPFAAACGEDDMYADTEPQEGEFAVGEEEDVNDRASTEASGAESAELPIEGRPGGEATLEAPDAQASGDRALLPFTARGTEPGWILEMAGSTTQFEYDYGQQQVRLRTPEPRETSEGIVFQAQDEPFTARLTEERCTAASGMPHPFTVEVRYQDQTFQGCGGEPRELLTGDKWTVTAIGDMTVEGADTPPSIRFSEDDAGGSTGCNTFRAGYALTGETLTIEPAETTQMACSETAMRIEERFLDALDSVERIVIEGDGALTLQGPGASIEARRGG